MAPRAGAAGRLLYGTLFLIAVPVLLVVWARATEDVISLPPVRNGPLGFAMAAAGFVLMVSGWIAILTRGDGLPMNAFPPARFVSSGPYRWVSDPIYIGFGAMAFGMVIAAGSASGLWLVAPVLCLAMASLVIGYERPDLRRRFGAVARYRPRIALPHAGPGRPGAWERVSVFLLVFGPWLVAYYGVQFLGVPGDAFSVALGFERTLPVIQWTEFVYAAAYILVPATPLVIATRSELRRFAVAGLLATVVVTLFWLTIPAVVAYRPFEPAGLPGRLLEFERQSANGMASLPAFHVLWILLAADAWARTPFVRKRPLRILLAWTVALLVSVSCVTTGMHAALDVLAAALLFIPLREPAATWELLRSASEGIANSWREWRIGKVRFLNHGFYAALAATTGLLLAGAAAGAGAFWPVVTLGLCALAGAGLWAQALEGSPRLLRPFGYYGGIAGMLAGALVISLAGANAMLVLGAWAVAGPWVQAIGRLRCLVQGCCHGGPAGLRIGIRYFHARSRVTQNADLAAVPLHPTPLYSILGNGVTGLLLFRLWTVGASPSLVLGVYLMLTALARFVEESFRAEPQTRIVANLHIYHWFAMVAFGLGVVATTIPAAVPAEPFGAFHRWLLPAGLAFGLLAGSAMGMDFPDSDRRFSRLAAADGRVGLLPGSGRR